MLKVNKKMSTLMSSMTKTREEKPKNKFCAVSKSQSFLDSLGEKSSDKYFKRLRVMSAASTETVGLIVKSN